MIGVSSIDSLFSKFKIDEKGTREESTLVRRHPYDSKGENLVEKIDKSGFEEVKTLTSDVPSILDYKDFNYDSCSLIDCLSLLQSMIVGSFLFKVLTSSIPLLTIFASRSKNSESLGRLLTKVDSSPVPFSSILNLLNKESIEETPIILRSSSLLW